MFAYASRTGTRRNLEALRKAGWGLMVSAKGVWRTEGFDRYCLDNGAWTAFIQKQPFDETAFLGAYELLASKADFVVLPDIIAGGFESLDFSLRWRIRLPFVCPQLLAVQNGMCPSNVEQLVGPRLGIFVGGTTDWKEQTMREWGRLARARGAYCHVGRVNSSRRIALCATTRQICDMVGMSEQMVTRYLRFSQQKQSALAAVIMLDRTQSDRRAKG